MPRHMLMCMLDAIAIRSQFREANAEHSQTELIPTGLFR
ncbi:protein of unknown function [Candidatus Nitrospira inopinata]|uniref:Uncharacterized protein n=1 Tax=Candidatus Nitrospira inopinata TaxID=1715989 RepID=A0A0S4KTL8_9BACT|nr:protein of unknown function [Candidatus Nitrospira inopinata]